ncbi:MAG: hypothetical protein GTO55_08830 [Armatimonadetes bacterium]|nr:hypothetical protein [Armatimonadota bacterium]NIM24351.1 hypothetical protein [Armatimonadota bacterium]NIM68220.1 hypothetical protein [Armatimonadota bacterium]NIN06425.1 hypothetical protein [Armatimonadota bacterium]NIO76095.1 hypothetical protein [Armatimonadota bacterium]
MNKMEGLVVVSSQLAGSPATAQASSARAKPPARSNPISPLGSSPPLQASYQYDRILRQAVVTLQNPNTGGVVREIPPEKIRQIAQDFVLAAHHVFDASA